METKVLPEQPFGIKNFYLDGKPVVAVYEERLVKTTKAEALYEVKQFVADIGISAELSDTYIALKKEDGQYQLFCYAGGKLNKGPMCENYINDPSGFIYKDFRGKWFRAEHNCSGAIALGTYDAGIWLDYGKKSVSVSYLTEKDWRRCKYAAVEIWHDSYSFYAFQKSSGKYDLFVHYFNGVVHVYPNLSAEEIDIQKETTDVKKLPEPSETFKVVDCWRIRGKER